MKRSATRTLVRAHLAVTIVVAAALVFPVYGLANSVEPRVFGLPFALVWILAWFGLEVAALIALFRLEPDDPGDAP